MEQDFDFGDLHNVFFPSDNTSTNVSNRRIDTSKLPKDLTITKGKYRFKIGNPTGTMPTGFTQKQDIVMFIDEQGNFKEKAYTVDAVRYDAVDNKLYVDVDVLENPIPLFIIWGAVAAVVMIVGAITADSILEDVSSLTDNAVVEPVKELGKQPIVWAVLAIFLIPVLLSLTKKG